MYKLTKSTAIIRLADNANIAAKEDNRDYQEYLAWVAAGNTPEAAQTEAEILTEKTTALDIEYQTTIDQLAQDYSAALMADKLFGTSTADEVYTEYEAAVSAYKTALEAIE
ncbi:MAG: hypothetical protein H6Q72_970 [Firmicutes bacterium]|nr:hypothetical protein [Bacillota bacterium]